MSFVTERIFHEFKDSQTSTPGGSTYSKVYKQWAASEGKERNTNITTAFNKMVGIQLGSKPNEVLDVAAGWKERGMSDADMESAILYEAAQTAAKALVVLDQYHETGLIELQTHYAERLQMELDAYEDRPPF